MQKGNVIVHEVCHLAQFWIVTRARIIVILKVNLTKTILKNLICQGRYTWSGGQYCQYCQLPKVTEKWKSGFFKAKHFLILKFAK